MYRYALYFLGGLAVGVVGAAALSKCNIEVKPIATGLLSKTMDIKDAVVAKLEIAKENLEDVVAEARNTSAKSKKS